MVNTNFKVGQAFRIDGVLKYYGGMRAFRFFNGETRRAVVIADNRQRFEMIMDLAEFKEMRRTGRITE